MKKISIALVIGMTLGYAAHLVGQAIIPALTFGRPTCRVDFYVNNTPWEQVIAGGNLNVVYLLKTTEQLPNGQYQTGVAICWDNNQYNWNYTYR